MYSLLEIELSLKMTNMAFSEVKDNFKFVFCPLQVGIFQKLSLYIIIYKYMHVYVFFLNAVSVILLHTM